MPSLQVTVRSKDKKPYDNTLKKKTKEIPKVHKAFIEHGLEQGGRRVFLDYIWNELFAVQMGYAFSKIHTVSYSIIALQQAILNVKYPPIFWATARLLVESSSIEFMEEDLDFTEDEEIDEDKKKSKGVDYFKMSSAMGEVRGFGVTIKPPNINKSSFTFRPDVEENAIYFGFKGITRIGDAVIRDIIEKRPFTGLEDFLNRVKVNKIQATMLIKAGVFDDFGDRQKLLHGYCADVADVKNTLNMRNVAMLVRDGFIPKEYEREEQLFNFNRYIRKDYRFGDRFVLLEQDLEFLNYFGFTDIYIDEGQEYFLEGEWKKFYDEKMNVIRYWIKDNLDELLEKVNNLAVKEMTDKYAEKAGVRRIRLHDFRHSCASALISGSAPITAVSNFLGHSETTETLETYTHMFKKDLANVPKFFDTLEKDFNEKSSK